MKEKNSFNLLHIYAEAYLMHFFRPCISYITTKEKKNKTK